MTPIRLRVEMSGSSMDDLVERLYAQSRQFFGSEEFRLEDEIVVDVEVSVSGQPIHWSGRADFVNWREGERR